MYTELKTDKTVTQVVDNNQILPPDITNGMGVVRFEGKTNANATFGHGTLECLVTDESNAE